MLRAAIVMFAAFALVSLLGFRGDVSVLSGTVTSMTHAASGLAYACAWLAAVLLAPPLLIAGLVTGRAAARLARTPGAPTLPRE